MLLQKWPKLRLTAVVILAVLAVVVTFQNRDNVSTRLLFVTIQMPHAILLFATLAIGFAIGVVTGGIMAGKKAA